LVWCGRVLFLPPLIKMDAEAKAKVEKLLSPEQQICGGSNQNAQQ
jgi:hypothetical protein